LNIETNRLERVKNGPEIRQKIFLFYWNMKIIGFVDKNGHLKKINFAFSFVVFRNSRAKIESNLFFNQKYEIAFYLLAKLP
jgi:hypothetical protein